MGKAAIIQWNFRDTSEQYTLFLQNSVLNYWPDSSYGTPDTTVTLTRDSLNKVFARQTSFEALANSGEVDIKGDAGKLKDVLSLQTDFSENFWFNIVTP